MGKTIIYDKAGMVGRVLAQSLSLFGGSYQVTDSQEVIEQAPDDTSIDSILFVVGDKGTSNLGNQVRKRSVDTQFIFATLPQSAEHRESFGDISSGLMGERYNATDLAKLVQRMGRATTRLEPVLERDYGFAFEADAKGLTQVLMDQFSEPLLCFRELVQNSVDANSGRIDINTGYDANKKLLSVSVADDGTGMTLDHIKTYLTLFDSTKDTDIKKIGQMGAGKVFAHALGPDVTVVRTGDGNEGHKVVFNSDLSGRVMETEPYKGTDVQLLIPMNRGKAIAFNKKLGEVVRSWCKYVKTPLYINGEQINEPFDLEGKYVSRVSREGLEAVIRLSEGRSSYDFFKGGILLEEGVWHHSDRWEKGNIMRLFEGLVDAEGLDFPISRNGVVRNDTFEQIFKDLKKSVVTEFTPRFLEDYTPNSRESHTMRDFFYHVLANGGYGKLEDEILKRIRQLPLLENADGTYLSVDQLRDKIEEHGCLYYTSNGLSSTELSAFLQQGIPVIRNPDSLVENELFRGVRLQCLDSRYYRGEGKREIGAFDFYAISSLLQKGFKQKVSAGSIGGGGFAGIPVNEDGTFDNPFDFSKLEVYGALFKNLHGYPEQTVLLDSYNEGFGYNRRHVVIFNVNHPFMQQMEQLSGYDTRLLQYYIACELIKSEKVFSNVSHKLREHEMSRIGLKVVDYE